MEALLAKLMALATAGAIKWTIGGIAGFVILWLLKKCPNEQIKSKFGWFMYGVGVGMTLGAGVWAKRWKISHKIYQKIEDWFVDLVENSVVYGICEWARGMRSDNKLKERTVLDTKEVKKKR